MRKLLLVSNFCGRLTYCAQALFEVKYYCQVLTFKFNFCICRFFLYCIFRIQGIIRPQIGKMCQGKQKKKKVAVPLGHVSLQCSLVDFWSSSSLTGSRCLVLKDLLDLALPHIGHCQRVVPYRYFVPLVATDICPSYHTFQDQTPYQSNSYMRKLIPQSFIVSREERLYNSGKCSLKQV